MRRSTTSVTRWNLVFNYASIIIAILNGLVIVPFYLQKIDHALFGAWLASGNILVWLTIIEPGVGDVLQQKVGSAYGAKDFKQVGLFIGSGIAISTVISTVVVIACFLFQFLIAGILNLSPSLDIPQLLHAFTIAALGTGFILLSYAFVGSNQGLQSSLGIGTILVVAQMISLAANVFLLFRGYGLLAIAYSTLIRGVGVCLGNIIYLTVRLKKEKIPLLFDKTFFISFSKLFSYTFFSKISNTVVNNLDLVLVARFVNPETVTMLELTRRPITIIQSFTNRISVAFMPSLAHLHGEGNMKRVKDMFINFTFIFSWSSMFIIFSFVAFNKDLLTVWAGHSVYIGNPVNILICLSLLITSYTYNISNFTFALGNIKGNSFITIVKSISYVLLMFVLGYLMGIYGFLIASILSVIVSEAWYYPKKITSILSLDNDELWNPAKENLKLLLIGVVMCYGYYLLNFKITNWFGLIAYGAAFTLVYFIILFFVSERFQAFIKKSTTAVFLKLKRQPVKSF
jgi:O-antigen/teichoic acid export membrane protein